MNDTEKKMLLDALTRLAGVYQVLDGAVLHTNNTNMLMYVREFKAVQNGVLGAIATIKDTIKLGYKEGV